MLLFPTLEREGATTLIAAGWLLSWVSSHKISLREEGNLNNGSQCRKWRWNPPRLYEEGQGAPSCSLSPYNLIIMVSWMKFNFFHETPRIWSCYISQEQEWHNVDHSSNWVKTTRWHIQQWIIDGISFITHNLLNTLGRLAEHGGRKVVSVFLSAPLVELPD